MTKNIRRYVLTNKLRVFKVESINKQAKLRKYPFEQLEIGQSFFVPVSEDKPNPAKSLASTVTSANDRHAYEIEGETMVNRKGETVPKKGFNKRFIVRPVEDGAAWGFAGQAGAAVWRIEPETVA